MEHRMPFSSDRIDMRVAKEGLIYEDENVKVTYFRTKHIEPRPSYSILIEAEGKKVLFTGDMSQWLAKEDFPKYALENETDLVVCEMAHFTPEQIKPYVDRLKTKHLCFNHVYPFDKFDAINDMDKSGSYDFPITIAHDDDEIIL
jgi:ribonuclease BN (tRNA processing enzyme)